MSGQRIDDHSSWVGKGSRGTVFADGAKTKSISEQEGAGSVMRYEDTEQAVKAVQSESVRQIKGRPLKPGSRY